MKTKLVLIALTLAAAAAFAFDSQLKDAAAPPRPFTVSADTQNTNATAVNFYVSQPASATSTFISTVPLVWTNGTGTAQITYPVALGGSYKFKVDLTNDLNQSSQFTFTPVYTVPATPPGTALEPVPNVSVQIDSNIIVSTANNK